MKKVRAFRVIISPVYLLDDRGIYKDNSKIQPDRAGIPIPVIIDAFCFKQLEFVIYRMRICPLHAEFEVACNFNPVPGSKL
jgi:hypothetical protein